MTAFPPIDALDGVKPEYHTMPGRGGRAEEFEKGSMRVVSFVQQFVLTRLYKGAARLILRGLPEFREVVEVLAV